MSKDIVLYGFDGSTYVRTVRMLLAEKGAEYEQVPVNVLAGEPKQEEHPEGVGPREHDRKPETDEGVHQHDDRDEVL
jgi:hypothetical protein